VLKLLRHSDDKVIIVVSVLERIAIRKVVLTASLHSREVEA